MDMKTIFTVLIRAALVSIGGALASHGLIQASGVDQFVSIGISVVMLLGGIGWSFWDKYGRPILTAKLEAWKLQALANAAALRAANVPVPAPPSASRVNAVTPSEVTPAIAAKAVESVAAETRAA